MSNPPTSLFGAGLLASVFVLLAYWVHRHLAPCILGMDGATFVSALSASVAGGYALAKKEIDDAAKVVLVRLARGRASREVIRYISIASSVRVEDSDPSDPRVIIPVNAKDLMLMPGTLISVRAIAARICMRLEDCAMTLLSGGPSYDDKSTGLLQCQRDKISCCTFWPKDLESRLKSAKSLAVYLGERHKHCSPLDLSCRDDHLATGPEAQ